MALDPENVIGSIYEAACEPQMWPDILRDLSQTVGGAALYLCHVPMAAPAAGYTWTHDFDPACVAKYKRDYAPHEPDVRVGITQQVGILQDRRAVYDDASFFRDPGHRTLFGAQGLTDGVLAPPHRGSLTMSMFLCMRGKRHGPLEKDAVAALQRFMPHMRRALAIQQRVALLEGDVHLVSDAIKRLTLGVLIVADDLRLLFANSEAERILALEDGLIRRGGRLVVVNVRTQAAFRALIAAGASGHVYNGESGHLPIARPSGAPALSAFVAPRSTRPIGGNQLPSEGVATVFLTDPVGPGGIPSAEALQRQFGLTRAEAEVARLVALGSGLPHAARELKVSINTARSHLRVVFEKLGVNQQAAVASRIARSFPLGMV